MIFINFQNLQMRESMNSSTASMYQ